LSVRRLELQCDFATPKAIADPLSRWPAIPSSGSDSSRLEIDMTLIRKIRVPAPLGMFLLVAACAEDPAGETSGVGAKTAVGAVGGAAAGAAAGYYLGGKSGTGAIVGGIAGALLGGYIGNQLDEADRREAQAAATRAVNGPVGRTESWRNTETGNSGSVRTVGEAERQGRLCRSFESTVRTRDGQTDRGTGTACQNADGSWSIL